MADPVQGSTASGSGATSATNSPPSPAPQADEARDMIDRSRQLGVVNPAELSKDLARAYTDNVNRGAALHAQINEGLSPRDQQSLGQHLSGELGAVASSNAFAAANPAPVDAARYPSANAAAYNALTQANPLSIRDNTEYGGLVFKDQATGRYSASNPTAGDGTTFDPGAVPVPKGAEVAGDYHTHGDFSVQGANGKPVRTSNPALDDYDSSNFSRQDTRGIKADAAGKPEYTGYLGTPDGAYRSYGPVTGTDAALRTPLPNTARAAGRGSLVGAGFEAGLGTVRALRDGRIDSNEAGNLVAQTAKGAAVGGAYTVTEQGLVRAIDQKAGSAVQRATTTVVTRAGGAEAETIAAGTRFVASRLGGAGAAGAVISAGLSIYDNREGLAHGDSQAIGRVAGDAVVGAGAALSGAAAGAVIGSAVPVLGTAVGAVVGLGIGIGADYVMRAGGVDKAVANLVAGGVDAVKGAASRVTGWLGW
jgi:hypothetical protein